MAHELFFQNGIAQMFSVKKTAWHNEGHLLPDNPSYQDAIKLVGFDYPMEKRPYFRPTQVNGNPGYIESGDAFYIFRPDINKVLGSVGSNYEIVTNEQAFSPLQPLVDQGVLKLETGGVLRDGADAWLLGKWDLDKFGPDAKEVFGDQVIPYATVMANHNGRRGIMLGNTPIRIVCANTLGAAERSGISRWVQINHTRDAKNKLFEAANEMFSRVVERFEVIARQYRVLMNSRLTLDCFRKLVLDVVAPDPRKRRDWNPEAKMAASVVERHERKVREVTRLWTCGKGHTGEPTAWFAYNGAVECLDFNRDLFPTRSGCYRTASLLTGELAGMKERVLDGLVSYASNTETQFVSAA
jgi:phage/plasmid-like protein (TIGR03299 family)